MSTSTSTLSRLCRTACACAVFIGTTGLPAQSQVNEFTPVTDADLQKPDPADWLMWRRTLDGWGYSPLAEIDRNNIGSLQMGWTRALEPGRQQGTPLVYNGVMYMPNPRDIIQAIDAVTGDLIWNIVVLGRKIWPIT